MTDPFTKTYAPAAMDLQARDMAKRDPAAKYDRFYLARYYRRHALVLANIGAEQLEDYKQQEFVNRANEYFKLYQNLMAEVGDLDDKVALGGRKRNAKN